MSNLEAAPAEVACSASRFAGIEVLRPRDVPLGGPQALQVQRTLPQRQRSLIAAWCFVDHYGPATRLAARMDVPPHPHTGLQTVSWLFSGEVEHRDSAGVHAIVRPGEVNLMTAGAGICPSEVSVAAGVLHGVQLWVALPDFARDTKRDFAHYAPAPISLPGARVRVFLGELAGSSSPVHTFTALVGAQIDLNPDMALHIDVDPAFEHGVLCDAGELRMGEATLVVGELGYQGPGRGALQVAVVAGPR